MQLPQRLACPQGGVPRYVPIQLPTDPDPATRPTSGVWPKHLIRNILRLIVPALSFVLLCVAAGGCGSPRSASGATTDANSGGIQPNNETSEIADDVEGGSASAGNQAVELDFEIEPAPELGQNVWRFSATASSSAGGPGVGVEWDFGDDGYAHGWEVDHEFAFSGEYVVTARLVNGSKIIAEYARTMEIDVVGLAPASSLTAGIATTWPNEPDRMEAELYASHSQLHDGETAQIVWRFSDGPTQVGNPVTHHFSQRGTHSAVLTITTSEGRKATVTKTLFARSVSETEPLEPASLDSEGGDPEDDSPLDDDSDEPTDPLEPAGSDALTADAAADQIVSGGDRVFLDGTSSTGADGEPLVYLWRQIAGPSVVLDDDAQDVATFVAPEASEVPAALVFELEVRQGEEVDRDETMVVVRAARATVVTADAGPDQTVTGGETVALDGTGTTVRPPQALSFSWIQVSGPDVTLDGAETATPDFVAPTPEAVTLVLVFEMTAATSDASDSDTVTVNVTPLEPEAEGFPVAFLSGPDGPTPPGPAEVSWTFATGGQVSGVYLLLDCCSCADISTEILTPDTEGVYRATIDVPEDETAWYSVMYTAGGVQYRSQSIYVNTPPGSPAESPPVIWYQPREFDPAIIHEVIRSGVVTHVQLTGSDRDTFAFDAPATLEAIEICRSAGLKVIWNRHLWSNWGEFETIEDTFDPDFYAAAIAQVRAEAAALGADLTSLDGECYSNSPLHEYLRSDLPPESFEAMGDAMREAALAGRVDFVYPCGSHGRPAHPNNLYGLLARSRVAESTYYDLPHKNCRISYPFEIFGAFVQPTTERPAKGEAPYFLPHDVVERAYLWSQADGALESVNGLFLYPQLETGNEGILWEVATMMADYFAGP